MTRSNGAPSAWRALFPILVGLVYGVSPIDIVPDLIPLIGWLDDGVVMLLMFGMAIWYVARRRPSPQAIRVQARPVAPPVNHN
ncbi:MAG: DUF1232 domain-containing protein [Fimbriimonadaceae bacterium]|nr:DUF1232 domain-containing protein [Fimbriimonadaceae bacterium]QYK56254.1 MAG: DUF1232 domain-containing protein [Fimbriimonadaceae bacterium]